MMTRSSHPGKPVTKQFVLEQSKWQFGPSFDQLAMDMTLPIQEVPIPGEFKLV